MAPPRPTPDIAFGFVLDDEFRRRWAQRLLDEHHSDDAPEFKSFEQEDLLSTAMLMMISDILEHVYKVVGPRLPRLQYNLLPVRERGVLVPRHYVFVLQEHRGTMPPTPENVELVRKALGLGEEAEPIWVPIDRQMC